MQYLAEQGQAYWLIDAIASYFGSDVMNQAMKQDARLQSMQFWRLEVQDNAGVLSARADDGVVPLVRQEIEYTDFPLPAVDIWAAFDGARWTRYLPSEH